MHVSTAFVIIYPGTKPYKYMYVKRLRILPRKLTVTRDHECISASPEQADIPSRGVCGRRWVRVRGGGVRGKRRDAGQVGLRLLHTRLID